MKFEWEKGGNRETFDEPLRFEDFNPDLRFNSLPWVSITSDDVISFGLATRDRNALHTDEAYAKTTALHGIVAHGGLVVNSLFGCLHHVGFWNKTLEALLETHARFVKPVRPGERVKHFLRVLEAHPAERHPEVGIVTFEFHTLNGSYEQVVEGSFSVLIRKKNKSS